MKSIKNILSEQSENLREPKFYRFQIFTQGCDRRNTVGMAYLREGQNIYTLRLWTFLDFKFFLLPNKDDSTKYLLMTREHNKAQISKNKYFWNIVGNAQADTSKGVIELNFDLFDKKIYMSIFPEESSPPYGQPMPEILGEAA